MTGEEVYATYCELQPRILPGPQPTWSELSWSDRERFENTADDVNAKIARDNDERKLPYA